MQLKTIYVAIARAWVFLIAYVGEAQEQGDACEIEITSLDFGIYKSEGVSSTAQLRIRCPETDDYTVAISEGQSGTFWSRSMSGPRGKEMEYNLFTTSTYQEVWGDGLSGTSTVAGRGNQIFTIYGRVPGGQSKIAGEYHEHLVVTLSF